MGIKFKIECQGQSHEIIAGVVRSESGAAFDLQVQIPDHDRDYELSLMEFGEPEPMCFTVEKLFHKGSTDVFLDSNVSHQFLKSINEQGIEALGCSREEFAHEIVDFLEYYITTNIYEFDITVFMSDVKAYLSWFKDTEAFDDDKHHLARQAYRVADMEFFAQLNSISMSPLSSLIIEYMEVESGPGHAVESGAFTFKIGEDEMDTWRATYYGQYDIETMEWVVHKRGDSENPGEITQEFLRQTHGEYLEIEERHLASEEPGYPQRAITDKERDVSKWLIRHDDYPWGYYRKESDARKTFEAMRDAAKFMGGSGVDIRLMRLKKRRGKLEWEEVEKF